MGSKDRVTRVVVGLALIATGIVLQVTQAGFWWLALIGVVLVGTSSVGVCPAYLPFNLSTRKKRV
jgi:mannose/fructose/N-acetylgalactosamine-specific phosphotransferase system component IIC